MRCSLTKSDLSEYIPGTCELARVSACGPGVVRQRRRAKTLPERLASSCSYGLVE
jgi:hypothetical protein